MTKKKSCKKGYYYCNTDEKCKKIPKGYHLMPTGYLMKDSDHKEDEKSDDTEGKKKNGNGNGSNGNGNGNGGSNGGSDGGGVSEAWSAKYKKSIDCDNPKGFSQKAHCRGRKIDEGKDGMSDHEVSMAKGQVRNSITNLKRVEKVLKTMTDKDDLPAWLQAKITDTEHNTDAAAGYMDEGTLQQKAERYAETLVNKARGTAAAYDAARKKAENVQTTSGSVKVRADIPEEVITEKRDGKSSKDKGYSLRDWFRGGGWKQTGGKYDGKPCAKQPGQKTKPYCRDADDRAAMSKEERNKRARKKRKEDPNPNRKGKAKNVTQESYSNWRADLEQLDEIAPAIAAGAALGIGAGGLYMINKIRQQKKTSDQGQGDGGLVDRLNKRKQMLQQLGNSYQPEGEVVEGYDEIRPYDRIKMGDGKLRTIKDIDAKLKEKKPVQKNSFEPEGELVDEGKKDACYHKVKSRYSVWPSAYASGALVKCRKVGAKNWGNKTKKEGYEFSNWRDDFQATEYESVDIIKPEPLKPTEGIGSQMLDEKCWKGYEKKGMKTMFGKRYPNCVKKKKTRKEEFEVSEGKYSRGEIYKKGTAPHRDPVAGESYPKEKYQRKVRLADEVQLGEKKDPCWDTHEMKGMKKKGNRMVPNCVPKEQVSDWRSELDLQEDWQKANRKDKTDGMSQKAVDAYKRENPGSKLKTAVTGNPKKGSKDAKRRKSFCSRSNGQRKMHNIDCSKTPDKKICKARRRWKC